VTGKGVNWIESENIEKKIEKVKCVICRWKFRERKWEWKL
jgi:hypothetical protein